MKISEFAESHGLEQQTIRKYLSRHPEIMKHTHKDGRLLILEQEAVEALSSVYTKRPVHILQGVDPEEHERVVNELSETSRELNEIRKRLADLAELAGRAEGLMEIIKDKDKQLSEKQKLIEQAHNETLLEHEEAIQARMKAGHEEARADELQKALDDLRAETEKVRLSAEEFRNELERVKSRGLWARIMNR